MNRKKYYKTKQNDSRLKRHFYQIKSSDREFDVIFCDWECFVGNIDSHRFPADSFFSLHLNKRWFVSIFVGSLCIAWFCACVKNACWNDERFVYLFPFSVLLHRVRCVLWPVCFSLSFNFWEVLCLKFTAWIWIRSNSFILPLHIFAANGIRCVAVCLCIRVSVSELVRWVCLLQLHFF